MKFDDFNYAVVEVRASGPVVIFPMKKREIELPYLQRVVDGPIDIVPVPLAKHKGKKLLMVVNDEGLLKGLKGNALASALYLDYIVGDVVIGIQDTVPEPDIYALPLDEAREIAQFIKDNYATMRSYD